MKKVGSTSVSPSMRDQKTEDTRDIASHRDSANNQKDDDESPALSKQTQPLAHRNCGQQQENPG